MWILRFIGVLTLLLLAGPARASNAKAEVVVAIDQLEQRIAGTRWNLNTLDQKAALQRELRLLHQLYDRIIAYEGELNTFPCAGAVLTPGEGPPRSTEATDAVGLLAQRDLDRAARASGAPTFEGLFTGPWRVGFLAQITDVEVRLLAQVLMIDDRLATTDWHLNNQDEKKQLLGLKASLQSSLRRVRNSRC